MMLNTPSYLTDRQISKLGLKSVGNNVKISKYTNFYGAQFISIGSNSRIDDFCILSASPEGLVSVGNHVHISTGVNLFGAAGIQIADFSGLSSGVKIYSISDDFSGDFMTNPTLPRKYLNVQRGLVVIEKHVIIGAGTVILPGVKIGEGVAVGALSLVTKSLSAWHIYIGQPARKIKTRSKKLLKLEKEFISIQHKRNGT
jgi:galactoside O-acetyltransferase